jgi:hypothetical protein
LPRVRIDRITLEENKWKKTKNPTKKFLQRILLKKKPLPNRGLRETASPGLFLD